MNGPRLGSLLQQLTLDDAARSADSPRHAYLAYLGTRTIAVVVVSGAVLGGWWLRQDAIPQVETVAARLAASSTSMPTAVLEATGYVVARRQATVSTQITGTITDVLMEEGESVVAGQVLTRLEDTAQSAALSEAEARVQVDRSKLGLFEAQLRQAQRDLERKRNLARAGAVSTQAMEAAMTEVDVLRSQIQSQQRQVELARVQVQGATVQLSHTVVRAPFSGVVVAKTAQAGEIVSPMSAGGGFTRTGIGTIVDMDSLEIEVEVNEAYINRVRPKQPGQAILDAYPEWSVPVHVIAIVPTADRSKATVKVRVAIEEKDARILPDMGVRVSLHDSRVDAQLPTEGTGRDAGVLIPKSALIESAGSHWVFVARDTRAHKQAVSILGPAGPGELLQVLGISAGARVILRPPPGLSDGGGISVAKYAGEAEQL